MGHTRKLCATMLSLPQRHDASDRFSGAPLKLQSINAAVPRDELARLSNLPVH